MRSGHGGQPADQSGLQVEGWLADSGGDSSESSRLGLTQKQLADKLGLAEATLSRWETGAQIRQRSLDKLLRLFFDLAMVQEALSGVPQPVFLCLKPTDKLRERAAHKFRLTAAERPPVPNDSKVEPQAKSDINEKADAHSNPRRNSRCTLQVSTPLGAAWLHDGLGECRYGIGATRPKSAAG